jgi:hypothetical protein
LIEDGVVERGPRAGLHHSFRFRRSSARLPPHRIETRIGAAN